MPEPLVSACRRLGWFRPLRHERPALDLPLMLYDPRFGRVLGREARHEGGAAVWDGDLNPVGSVWRLDNSIDRVGVRMLSLCRGFPPVVEHGDFLGCDSIRACRGTCFRTSGGLLIMVALAPAPREF